jgi:hypothetical protein
MCSFSAYAQVPQAIPYQAVARNSAGVLLANQNISVRLTVRNSVAAGPVIYRETHTLNTNNLGLFTVNLGQGTPSIGTFGSINWSTDLKFLQVEMDPNGGVSYTDMGTQQFLSVPYALVAGSTTTSNSWSLTGNSGLVDSLNFIGNAGSGFLNFRVNNQKSGRIDLVSENTFFGYLSGSVNTTGISNTAVGNKALSLNTTGRQSTAIGSEALLNNVGAWGNTAVGYQSQVFANNTTSQVFPYNTSIGHNALRGSSTPSANTGTINTAIGGYTLYFNSSGSNNTAVGFQSLSFNTTGSINTGVGFNSLYQNVTGMNNVAVGGNAFRNNVAGNNGVAIGNESQYYANNTSTAWDNTNTSVGYRSLQGISTPASNTGVNNTALGRQSMQITSFGSNNTSAGAYSFLNNETGSDNTIIGYNSGIGNSSGNGNTSLGSLALYYNITGSNNTAIGYNAGPLLGSSALTNATAIGYNAKVSVSNALILGNNGVFVGIGLSAPTHKLHLATDDAAKPSTNTWTIISDARLKNIDGVYTKGLQEILQLKPLRFHYKNTADFHFSEDVVKTQSIGFLAQDVQPIFPECVSEDANGYLNLNIHAIIIAQINAIKEQQELIESLKTENEKLKENDELLRNDLAKIKSQLGM